MAARPQTISATGDRAVLPKAHEWQAEETKDTTYEGPEDSIKTLWTRRGKE